MAATISDLANGVSAASSASVATGATVTASVGDWLVVLVAASNDGSGGASSISSVVDSDGVNTYTQRAIINYDPGAAGAGATLGIYTCQVTNALSLDTITVNFSPNTAEKAVQVYRVQPGASESISLIAVDTTGSTGNATSHAAATVSVTSGDIIFGAAAIETDDAITGDSDTTNGSWSTILSRLADSGADAATMTCSSQHKTTTGTGDQSWACTTASGRDSARTYLVLRSAAATINSGDLSGAGSATGTLQGAGIASANLSASGSSTATLEGMAIVFASADASAPGSSSAILAAVNDGLRITEEGDQRWTEDGQDRITEGFTDIRNLVLSSSGSSTAIAQGAAVATGQLSATASSSATLEGKAVGSASLSAAGAGTGTLQGAARASGNLSAAGQATATAAGSSVLTGQLSTAGSATATAQGLARASGNLSAAGAATGTLEGHSRASGDLSAAGQATATAQGAARASGNLSAAGAATATGEGKALGSGSLASDGTASGSSLEGIAVAAGFESGDLSSAGSATAEAQGASIATGHLSAAGEASATLEGIEVGGAAPAQPEAPISESGLFGGGTGWNDVRRRRAQEEQRREERDLQDMETVLKALEETWKKAA